MQLVVGLGNPGRRYEATRHNAGFVVVDRLCARWGAACDKKQFGALVGKARIKDKPALLCKPQTFMNLSGQAAASLKGFYKVDLPDICVVHDEVDLPLGRIKVKVGGGHGGHNGLRDLQAKLGGNGFIRVRVGVSRPPEGWETADYVLSTFTEPEKPVFDDVVDRAADAVEVLLSEGVLEAMKHFNTRQPAEESDFRHSPGE